MNITASVMRNKIKILPFALFAAFASQATDVNGINHGRSADGAYEVQIVGDDFSGVTSYSLSNPARIVVDIPNGKSQLANNLTQIDSPVVSSVAIIEGDDRVRATINMKKSVPYVLKDTANKITVALKDPLKGPLREANKVSGTPMVRKADIDFTSGINGQGKVKIKLPSNDVGVSVQRIGGKVVAKLSGGTFAKTKRMNVSDFGTAVKSIDVYNNQLKISTRTKNYNISSYQGNRAFYIEFNKPVAAKVEQKNLPAGDSRRVYNGKTLSLNFQDIEVRAVLQLIGDFTNQNIVVDGAVNGSITLRLNDVPWDQALDVILQAKGLSMQKNGTVMYIAPSEVMAKHLKSTYAISNAQQTLAPLQRDLIKVNYARAEKLLKVLETSSAGGNGEGESKFLSSPRGSITVDERTNTLVVRDVQENIERIRKLVTELDIPVRHVLIDARIVSASSDYGHELGVRWGGSGFGSGSVAGHRLGTQVTGNRDGFLIEKNGNGTNKFPVKHRLGVDLGVANPTGSLAMRVLGSDFLLDMELSAMESNGRGEVISSPRVVAQDGNKATIKSGQKIPYATRDKDGVVTIKFEEAVLLLDVTPKIAPNNMIDMILDVKKDTLGRSVSTGTSGSRYLIDNNSVETQVLVDNGETVVLGGIYEQMKKNTISKVPFFGDLPVVGRAFRKDINSMKKSELLIFVTPKIIDKRLLSNDKFSSLRG